MRLLQSGVWLTEWSYPGAQPPRVWRRTEDELKLIAEKDMLLFDMGYRLTPEAVKETYGEGYERKAEPPPEPPLDGQEPAEDEEPTFAEPAEPADSLQALTEAALEDEGWREVIEPAIDPIRKLVEEVASLEELQARLGEALGRMGTGALAEHLARAMFQARLAGSTEAPIVDDPVRA